MSDIWSWQNYADSGAITTNAGADGALTLDNLKDPRPGKLWRGVVGGFDGVSSGVYLTGADGVQLLGWDGATLMSSTLWSGGEVRVDFGQDRALAVVGAFNCNLGAMTQVEFRLGSTPGGSEVWRESVSPASIVNRMAVRAIRNPNSGRWGTRTARHLTIAFTGAPIPEMGRIWAGPANWRPSVSHVLGSGSGYIDFSSRTTTPRSGAWLIDEGARRRTFTAAYDAISEDEYLDTVQNMNRDAGLSRQMLFVPNPDVYPWRWPILGYLQQANDMSFVGFLRAAREFPIQEAG